MNSGPITMEGDIHSNAESALINFSYPGACLSSRGRSQPNCKGDPLSPYTIAKDITLLICLLVLVC